jgi:hypothetical protein
MLCRPTTYSGETALRAHDRYCLYHDTMVLAMQVVALGNVELLVWGI